MVKETLIVILLSLVVSVNGCGIDSKIEEEPQDTTPLNLYMELPIRDGLYIFDYPDNRPHSYTSVLYQTEPMTRVFWYSPDSFDVYFQYHWFSYPIINYSTYSNGNDGSGKQMIYIYEPHIGDTLEIIGCIDDNNCRSLSFLVE